MIVDAARERAAFAEPVDVCVIGAGPAGITLARALAAAGASVALMEAGGLEISAESQDAYVGTTVGLDYFPLDTCRLRYFGGTSGHWGGMCRNLDAYDFEPHARACLERLADRQGRPRPLPRGGPPTSSSSATR